MRKATLHLFLLNCHVSRFCSLFFSKIDFKNASECFPVLQRISVKVLKILLEHLHHFLNWKQNCSGFGLYILHLWLKSHTRALRFLSHMIPKWLPKWKMLFNTPRNTYEVLPEPVYYYLKLPKKYFTKI